MKRFAVCIAIGCVLILVGATLGLSDDPKRVWTGAMLCWMALPMFWLASKMEPR